MPHVTRRSMLKSSLVLGAASLVEAGDVFALEDAVPSEVLPLTSNTGVTLPPAGHAFFKFSFDFPEPSVVFADHQVSFRVYTYENTYAMDPRRIHVSRTEDSLTLQCDGFTWAGGQETRAGHLTGTIRRTSQGFALESEAHIPGTQIKSISAVVRWVSRGEISVAAQEFADPKEDEVLHSWPDLMGGMPSPLLVIRAGDRFQSLSLAADPDTVRTARFYLQPGKDGYRAELTYEREAWTPGDSMKTATWHVRSGATYAEVAAPHYAHVERAFSLPEWKSRKDVPTWMHAVSLVVSLHGAHWTGYIFNDYAQQLTILKWIASQIDPHKVLVFLPAWDGRYYWNYPQYKTDPRMGGDAGFHKLITGGQQLGFHLVPMFGSNVANTGNSAYGSIKDSLTILPDGDQWLEGYVDWDNDRRMEANYGFMNLGVASWRNLLSSRIANIIETFGVDGYFLDIVGTAENNRQSDMFLGTRALVQGLGKRFPDKLCLGEMHYDALLGCIPVFQADVTKVYPEAVYKYGRMFEHLSWPAFGRGSTGVHEFGFSDRMKLPTVDQNVIPTLSVVDDTFGKHRQEMLAVIEVARQWRGYQG